MTLILDGPMGTELLARGVPTPLPLWSAEALRTAPETVRAIHESYSLAGAAIHTTNTFRTKRRTATDWESLARRAVALARIGNGRVAGSIAPLEDCYRPDLSPPHAEAEHRELADVLADAKCDLLLCETFPHVGEALAATRAAVATGLETWTALTAGPKADLLTPTHVAEAARALVDVGASAVLINCTPAVDTLPFVDALANAVDVPVGAYANAGSVDDAMGWSAPEEPGVQRYVELAQRWVNAGAAIIGGCCGTGPAHVDALRRAL